MAPKHTPIDRIMESASEALAATDYLTCEDRCLEALSNAAAKQDWAAYGRILLPLQEVRRQRRLIASEGTIRLGSSDLVGDPVLWLRRLNPGCLVLTHPHGEKVARLLTDAIRRQRMHVEVLWADCPANSPTWTLRGFRGTKTSCPVASPWPKWVNRWISPRDPLAGLEPDETAAAVRWFLDASQALGDAAMEQVRVPLGDPWRVRLLENCLKVVTDHEIIHQALADAARALAGDPDRDGLSVGAVEDVCHGR